MEVFDKSTLLDAIGKYCDELEYQDGNKHRIGAFISLMDICNYYEYKHFVSNAEELGFPEKTVQIISFFGHVNTICEQSLMFFICSEISNSVQARPYGALLKQIFEQDYYKKTIIIDGEPVRLPLEFIEQSLNSLQDLFVNRYDQTVGSHILDFNISMFSSFEHWITKLAENYENEMVEKYTLSRLKKCQKYLEAYECSNTKEDKEKYLKKLRTVPGNYLSFPDKFNFVLSKIDDKNYPREKQKDKELIEFLRISRNTIHNGGIHKGKDTEYIHGDIIHRLQKNKPMYHKDYNDLIKLYAEVIEIYNAIISSLKDQVNKESLRNLSVCV